MRERYGVLIGTGLDKLRTSTLRIGTMGITASPQYVLPALSALELALRDLGHKAEPGAGVGAAQAAFATASEVAEPLIAVPDDFPTVFEGPRPTSARRSSARPAWSPPAAPMTRPS